MRLTSKLLILSILSGLFFACNPDKISIERNSEGTITRMPYHWRSSIGDGPRGSNLYRGYIIPNTGILYVGKRKASGPVNESYLGVKDFETGKDVWIWDGFFNKILKRTIRDQMLIKDNNILINDLDANYLVDALSGSEIWKKKRVGSVSAVTSLGDSFFFAAQAPGFNETKKEEDMVYHGDFKFGEVKPLVKPPYSGQFAKPRNGYLPFGYMLRQKAFSMGGDIMLIIPYEEMGPEGKFTPLRSFFGLYNVTKNKWVYDRAPLSFEEDGSAQSVMPIVDGNRVYLTSLATVGCYELETGKRLWQKRVTERNTDVMDILLADGRLLANTGDATLYCLDAQTGAPYWDQKSSGISSDMYYQDGVVYWIPSKNLRAVDIKTGKILWDLPTMDKEDDSHWWGFVTGVPGKNGEKGRIFATSDLYMYSFDAAQ